MYKKSSKKRERIRLIFVYSLMTGLVILLASFVILFMLGFRFDRDNGRIEQGALLQFDSTPSGALVNIDNQILSSSTPTKLTALPGLHILKMQKNNYETWSKSVVINSGALYWIDYARLVPKNRPLKTVKTYQTMSNNLYSPDGKYLLVHESPNATNFDLFDLRNDNVAIKSINLPDPITSMLKQSRMTGYSLTPTSWDKNGRYVLIRLDTNDKREWILLDTKNPEESKNISQILSLGLEKVEFSGTSGKIFYALASGELRRLDLDSNTISRSYYSKVSDFDMLNSSTLSFEATKSDASGNYKLVGIFRDGDQTPHIIRQVDAKVAVLKIALSQYANRDFVAILDSDQVTILKGSFPSSDSQTNDSMENYAVYPVSKGSFNIQFSPSGDYVISRSNSNVDTYGIEHKQNFSFKSEAAESSRLDWLDDNYIYGNSGNELFIQEFDGTNLSKLNYALKEFPASLSPNQKYIYLTSKQDSGTSISRIQMILD